MAITSSAKKALRVSIRKKVFNLRRKSTMQDAIKGVRKLVAAKQKDEALKALPGVYKAIDKAVKTKYIKANTGSRKKSRLTKLVNKIS
ncbi:MAG: 30S ribosomal protein S20 [Candidatus Paceibacterota bacterium]